MIWRLRSKVGRTAAITCALLLSGAAGTGVVYAANGSVSYAYDALGRIIAATYDTGACITYTYDAVGNRLSETILVQIPTATGAWDCSLWNSGVWGT